MKILDIMAEAADVDADPLLRLHAKDRLLRRLVRKAKDLGYEMMPGVEEDDGYIVARKLGPHGQSCDERVCRCEMDYRVEIP
jgi:hypothetical protein